LIVSWLVRLILGFAVLAVVLYDAGSIAVNYFTLDSKAKEIATAVSIEATQESFFNQRAMELLAEGLAEEAGARLIGFRLNRDATVKLTIRRRGDTLVVSRISAIENWARATADATIRSSN
jgi:hypothetical protein